MEIHRSDFMIAYSNSTIFCTYYTIMNNETIDVFNLSNYDIYVTTSLWGLDLVYDWDWIFS
jgi:hypothetical protein